MVDEMLRNRIDLVPLCERLQRLRERYFSEVPRISGDRARLAVEVWPRGPGA